MLLWQAPVLAEPPELSAERARELLQQIDHAEYERRQSAERILQRRLGDGLAELVATELGEPSSLSAHMRWRLEILLAGDAAPGSQPPDGEDPHRREQEGAWRAEVEGEEPEKTVRGLLLDLQAGRTYSTNAPAYVALLQLGPETRQQFMDAILDPTLSNTLHYYALMAYQKVVPGETLVEDLGLLLTSGDSYLISNIGQTFRNAGVAPDPVLALAKSKNPTLRIVAANAMASMRYSSSGAQAAYAQQVRDALLELLGDPIIDVAVAALGGLRNLGSRFAGDARVREAAASGDDELAAAAFECLRLSNDEEVLKLAVQRATTASPLVRARALSVVGQGARMQPKLFEELAGGQILEQASEAPELGVRIAAYDAIGSAQVTELTAVLRAALSSERVSQEDGTAAIELAAVIRNLSNLQDLDSLELLVAEVEHENDSVRTAVLSALRRLAYRADEEQSVQIRNAYRAVLHHTHSTTRYYAAQYLANIADEDSLKDLAPLLEDTDTSVRRAVHSGLSQLRGNERAAELLALALELDPEPMNRQSIARSLMTVGVSTEPVIAALTAALEDEDRDTRVNAAEAMHRMGIPGGEEARLRELVRMVDDVPSYGNLTRLRQAYADSDRPVEAAALSPRVIEVMPGHLPVGHEHVTAARFSVAAEDPEAALEYLRQAVELGYRNASSFRADQAFESLREYEEFQALTEGR